MKRPGALGTASRGGGSRRTNRTYRKRGEDEQNHIGTETRVVPAAGRVPAPSFLDLPPKLAGLLAATQHGEGRELRARGAPSRRKQGVVGRTAGTRNPSPA